MSDSSQMKDITVPNGGIHLNISCFKSPPAYNHFAGGAKMCWVISNPAVSFD